MVLHEDNIVERIFDLCRGVGLKEKIILPEL